MPISTAEVATERPDRYVKQLVSHLGQLATAELATAEVGADGRGVIALERGQCVLTPGPAHLGLIATAVDADALARIQDVVARHLVRFATQEELRVEWTEPADGDALELVQPVVVDYLETHCTPPDDLLTELVVRTREVAGHAAGMQIAHDEGALLSMLVRLAGARTAPRSSSACSPDTPPCASPVRCPRTDGCSPAT
ncbi:DUF2218 domain-containing protein [Actinopolymorpha singaporensis]|uniref:DUF2218 domain-containing protein n=1 Tax=Actinopolymorpha singaporensis TaxID=117157 RepID=UPI0018D47DEE|nr:DUF2218 domain-containing protein [Actinopolymorpha singaporensis]